MVFTESTIKLNLERNFHWQNAFLFVKIRNRDTGCKHQITRLAGLKPGQRAGRYNTIRQKQMGQRGFERERGEGGGGGGDILAELRTLHHITKQVILHI